MIKKLLFTLVCLLQANVSSYAQTAGKDVALAKIKEYADLVVLDKDIITVGLRDIADIQVKGTLLDGKFTYRDGPVERL